MTAIALEDYSDGTCFSTAFIGHASALSQAYYSPLRGASISSFRNAFVRNLMRDTWRLPSSQGSLTGMMGESDNAHKVTTEATHLAKAVVQHVIFLYNKTKDNAAPGFRCATWCLVHSTCCVFVPLSIMPPQLRLAGRVFVAT
jgi:hypothetical protein